MAMLVGTNWVPTGLSISTRCWTIRQLRLTANQRSLVLVW
ncbi:unnamed protein product [Coregonus sp. 'balchen']|nr:unnamed protein product [Coregonus sp. 'balchen']